MSERQVGIDIEALPPGRTGVFLTMTRGDALETAHRWLHVLENDRRPYLMDELVFKQGQVRDHRPHEKPIAAAPEVVNVVSWQTRCILCGRFVASLDGHLREGGCTAKKAV